MNSIQTVDCANKKVLVRVDLNVEKEGNASPIENLRLLRIKETLDTILAHPGATITLITHLGRPKNNENTEYSTEFLQKALKDVLNQEVTFTPDCLGDDDFTNARIALRENLRFYPEEESNDEAFAEKLSKGFDIYVNEAFSVCHRNHASVVAITKHLPSYAGINLQKELQQLDEALSNPARPAVAVLGGAKIETKLPLIRTFESKYDTVLLGGIIANEALDQNLRFQDNVLLPTDFRDNLRFDIGDDTVVRYSEILLQAKTILWNGPLGKFEEAPYNTGTFSVVDAMKNSQAFLIAGGGESLQVIQEKNLTERFDVLSSGGGAMLAYLGGEVLPGISALQ